TFGTVLEKFVTPPAHVVGIIVVLWRYSSQSATGTALPIQLNCCAADARPVWSTALAISCEFGRFWNCPMPPLICPRDPRCAPSKPPICGFVPYVQLNPSRGLTYTPRGTASLRAPKIESTAELNAGLPWK